MHGVSIIHLDFFRWADAKAKELLLFRTIQVVGCSFMANGHNYPGRGIPQKSRQRIHFYFLRINVLSWSGTIFLRGSWRKSETKLNTEHPQYQKKLPLSAPSSHPLYSNMQAYKPSIVARSEPMATLTTTAAQVMTTTINLSIAQICHDRLYPPQWFDLLRLKDGCDVVQFSRNLEDLELCEDQEGRKKDDLSKKGVTSSSSSSKKEVASSSSSIIRQEISLLTRWVDVSVLDAVSSGCLTTLYFSILECDADSCGIEDDRLLECWGFSLDSGNRNRGKTLLRASISSLFPQLKAQIAATPPILNPRQCYVHIRLVYKDDIVSGFQGPEGLGLGGCDGRVGRFLLASGGSSLSSRGPCSSAVNPILVEGKGMKLSVSSLGGEGDFFAEGDRAFYEASPGAARTLCFVVKKIGQKYEISFTSPLRQSSTNFSDYSSKKVAKQLFSSGTPVARSKLISIDEIFQEIKENFILSENPSESAAIVSEVAQAVKVSEEVVKSARKRMRDDEDEDGLEFACGEWEEDEKSSHLPQQKRLRSLSTKLSTTPKASTTPITSPPKQLLYSRNVFPLRTSNKSHFLADFG